jgi:hypothetical protein
MSVLNVREELQREISSLPEDLVREVLDFLMYVRDRQTEEDFLHEQIEAAEAYRREHPEDVIIMTAEEWEAATEPSR